MDRTQLSRLIHAEIESINRLLEEHNISAGAAPEWTLVAGGSYISYGLGLGRGQKIKPIENLLSELAELLAAQRDADHLPVRLRLQPLALEVPHPAPYPLAWNERAFSLPPHTALLGRSYGRHGAVTQTWDFASPHALVAGITGAGKSTLVNALVLSLALNTSPDELRFAFIDLKNDDLVALAMLPHCIAFANKPADAADLLRRVDALKNRRIDGDDDAGFRLILAIDEVQLLSADKAAIAAIGQIASVGRSLGIHIVIGTQHPTADVIGNLARANFGLRLAGLVGDASAAALVTGRGGSGAERLPGRGAFVRAEGPDLTRLQGYYLTASDVQVLVRKARAAWRAGALLPAPQIALLPDPGPSSAATTAGSADEIDAIAERIRPVVAQGYQSLAQLIRVAFGQSANTGGANRTRVLAALQRLQDAPPARATTTTEKPQQAPQRPTAPAWAAGSSSDRLN